MGFEQLGERQLFTGAELEGLHALTTPAVTVPEKEAARPLELGVSTGPLRFGSLAAPAEDMPKLRPEPSGGAIALIRSKK